MTEQTQLSLYDQAIKYVSAKEIFSKCWLLGMANSSFKLDANENEIETRYRIIANNSIVIMPEVMKIKKTNEEIRSLFIFHNDIPDCQIEIKEGEIKGNMKYLFNFKDISSTKQNEMVITVLRFFEFFKSKIRKIKQIEKTLIDEIEEFEKSISEIKSL